jgi:GntR family transcriptional regulator / MocR family aminotransferase
MTSEVRLRFSPLDPGSADALYRQIYQRFRAAIADGILKPGDRIPSARALTQELGLARGTIDAAYSMLSAEGYLEAMGQAGTFVRRDLKPRDLPRTGDRVPVSAPPPTEPSFRPETTLPLQMGLPALDEFPRKLWARLGAARIRAMRQEDMAQPPIGGLPELRAQLATYLQVSRGIRCSSSQIFITSGYHATMSLIAQALLGAGEQVWIESPSYPPTLASLESHQLQAVPVPVDADGLVVEDGILLAPRARAAVVTPAHQSPLGVSLSLARRLALLAWAKRANSWIVEDDYDGEYRYVGRPLPALKSLDRDDRVLYAGTFSKVLFPSIRMAYLVVPSAQQGRFEMACETTGGNCPQLTQAIVSDFMAHGHFGRHIQRMRKLYALRRAATAAAFKEVLGSRVVIDEQPGGMHLMLRLPSRQSDRRLAARMLAEGLYAEALGDWTGGKPLGPALLVSFTNVTSHRDASQLARRILLLMR